MIVVYETVGQPGGLFSTKEEAEKAGSFGPVVEVPVFQTADEWERVSRERRRQKLLAGLSNEDRALLETPPATPQTATQFVAWQCEKCGKFHDRYFPEDGCEWCRGDMIAERLGLR